MQTSFLPHCFLNIQIRGWARPDAMDSLAFGLNMTAQTLDFYIDHTDVDFPLPKIGGRSYLRKKTRESVMRGDFCTVLSSRLLTNLFWRPDVSIQPGSFSKPFYLLKWLFWWRYSSIITKLFNCLCISTMPAFLRGILLFTKAQLR